MIIKALHGFLGTPHDWATLFQGHALQDSVHAIDLFSEDIINMQSWAAQFNSKHHTHDKQSLLGYSLGGRLALHLLIDNPKRWSSAVIVSAHLGLDQSEKKQRSKIDAEWASRFENDPWDQLMNDWNHRKVFNHSFAFERKEKGYSRSILANVLRTWSLSHQEDLRERIAELPIPILWIAGENDLIYAEQASKVQLCHPLSEVWIVPKAGHRAPWQHPEIFLLKLSQFLEMV